MSRDRVFETSAGWNCVVGGVTHGTWASRAQALGGMRLEQQRAIKRLERAQDQRVADRVDGYDRDDIGESPDY